MLGEVYATLFTKSYCHVVHNTPPNHNNRSIDDEQNDDSNSGDHNMNESGDHNVSY